MRASAGLDAAFEELGRGVREGDVPGAVAAVGTRDGTLRRSHFGYAQLTPVRRELGEDALFDLASLTKVVCTATLALRLLERGTISLGQRIASALPDFGAGGKEGVTVRHILTHTSGLNSGLPEVHAVRRRMLSADGAAEVAELVGTRLPVLDLVCALPLARPVGSAVFYSDSAYFALGAFLAAAGGAPLEQLARREVFEPLGMRDTRFVPDPSERGRAAATEVVPGRAGALVGQVHDEMAALSGGVAGHAGLFSTCADLERFCRVWLGGGTLDGVGLLSAATVDAATRDQTGGATSPEGLPAHRGLGWSVPPNPRWHGGDACSPRSYGHTGFTGTSLLLDPERGVYAVLLTNRVHPTREGGSAERLSELRRRFHNAVWRALA
ncbi:MAG TPA: serine hydrolase domain-containing protein [Chloroflexota bacterium]|nr:serine hydrolase domain-containing protein [Chloroflexota bacterium]